MTTKTEQRIDWLKERRVEIEAARCEITPSPRGGKNARTTDGMSPGGYGWWAKALKAASIEPNEMSYWAGRNPTPSIAINAGIAWYIKMNAPEELR